MTKLTLSLLLVGAGIAWVLCPGQAVAQSQPSAATAPARPVPVVMDANMVRYWSDPNQLRLKDQLGATEEEWKVILPKVEKVQKLIAQLRGRRAGGRMVVFAMAGSGAAEPSDIEKAAQALADTLAKSDASPGDLGDALKALREARAKARAQLAQAQKELREVLTARQEAQLRQMGLFD